MFVKIVFVFLFCISFSLSEYTYKCGDDLKVGLCQLDDYENNIIYVSACPKGKKCITGASGSLANHACAKRESLLKVGKKCVSPYECESGLCSDKKCIEKKEGETCKRDENCQHDSYCKNSGSEKVENTCQKYLSEGAECEVNYDKCSVGTDCAKTGTNTKSTCVKYYSLDDGTKVSGGYNGEINHLCKSNYVFQKSDGTYACGTVKSASPCSAGQCTVTVSFESGAENSFSSSCSGDNICGYKVRTNTEEFNKYKEQYAKELPDVLADEDVKKSTVNTDHFGIKKLIEYYVDYYYKDKIPSEDSDCVRDFFIRQEGSSYIKVSILSLILLLLL